MDDNAAFGELSSLLLSFRDAARFLTIELLSELL